MQYDLPSSTADYKALGHNAFWKPFHTRHRPSVLLLILACSVLVSCVFLQVRYYRSKSEDDRDIASRGQAQVTCDVVDGLSFCELRSVCFRHDPNHVKNINSRLGPRTFFDFAFSALMTPCVPSDSTKDCSETYERVLEENIFLEQQKLPFEDMAEAVWIPGGTVIPPSNTFAHSNIYHQTQAVMAAVEVILLSTKERFGLGREYHRILFPQTNFFPQPKERMNVSKAEDRLLGYGYDMVDHLVGTKSPYGMEVELLAPYLEDRKPAREEEVPRELQSVCFDRVMLSRPQTQMVYNAYLEPPVHHFHWLDDLPDRFRSLESEPEGSGPLTIPVTAQMVKDSLRHSRDFDPPPRRAALIVRGKDYRGLVDQEGIAKALSIAALKKGFTFDVIENSGTFLVQAERLQSYGVVVSVHGANLLNTIFMPTGAVLLEIQPEKFPFASMNMYWRGSNAGIHYKRITSVDQEDNDMVGPGKQYETVDECVKKDRKCDLFYRNAPIKVDLDALREDFFLAMAKVVRFKDGYGLVPIPSSRTAWDWPAGYYVVPNWSPAFDQ